MLIDTHSHLFEEEFDADRHEAVERAERAGVERIVLPAIERSSNERLFEMCREYPHLAVPLMGLHPTSINENPDWREELHEVERWLTTPPAGVERFYGVGEIGLDLYWSRDFLSEQEEALRAQLDMALRFNLPVAIHTREAWSEMIEVVSDYRTRGLRGVFHAFAGDLDTYRTLREMGDFKFGVGGVVTYKKSGVAEVVREIPLEDILLETDSPYLTPVPYRGKRNESSYVSLVCAEVARIKGVEPDVVAAQTTLNAKQLFGLK